MIKKLTAPCYTPLKCDLLRENGSSGGGGGVLLRNCTLGDTSRESHRGRLTDLSGDFREGDLWGHRKLIQLHTPSN